MSPAVVLDSTPLGLLAHSRPGPLGVRCAEWLAELVRAGCRVIVAPAADWATIAP